MRNVLLASIIFFGIISCSHNLHGEFEQGLNKYNTLLRWNEFETASLFAAQPLQEEFLARSKTSNVRIYDYRIVNAKYDEQKSKASVEVEIDYYLLSTSRAKTLQDVEEWAYIEEKGIKSWRLMSPLPVFK
jgi:hypothetical protein